MNFIRLSALVDEIKGLSAPDVENVVENAALLMAQHYRDHPLEMLNIIVLSLLMDALTLYEISPGAIRTIGDVSIGDLPDSPPSLMRLPWLIESKDLNKPLFGKTVCLGGYYIRDKYFLIGFEYPDGARVEPWEPEWGKDLHIPLVPSPLVDEEMADSQQEWAEQAARFSLSLGILLDADKTPLVSKSAGKSGRRKRTARRRGTVDEWTVRRIVLGRMATRYHGQPEDPTAGLDQEGKVLSRAIVSGHLRYQPYGPGRGKRKWIWIDTYESQRWTSKKTKIEVE